jgi:hypothetical protein
MRRRRLGGCCLAVGFVLTLGAAPACRSAGPAGVTIDDLRNHARSTVRRAQEIETLPLDGPDRDRWRAELHLLVWTGRQPDAVRLAAIDRLRADDPDMFWRAAAAWLGRVDRPLVLNGLLQRTLDDERDEMIGPWIRRWADGVPDLDEALRLQLPRVSGDADADTLLGRVFAAADRDVSASAWVVLTRGRDDAAVRRGIAELPGDAVWTSTLRAADQVLACPVRTRDGLRWVETLRRDQVFWDRLVDRHGALLPGAAGSLERRHLGWLGSPSPSGLGRSLRASLERARTFIRSVKTAPRLEQPVDNLSASNMRSLGWADLQVLLEIIEAARDPSIVGAWFEQADADLNDRHSEHGGLLIWDPAGQLAATGYAAGRVGGDHRYIASAGLLDDLPRALAHYHFHAQAYDHADHAGPGRGDLNFADDVGATSLVLTFLDRETLNLDMVLPGWVVIDLGRLRRPSTE